MEIKKDSKIKNIFKRYGKIMIVAAVAFVVAFVAAVGVGVKDEGERHKNIASCRHVALRHRVVADHQKRQEYQ